MNIEDYRFYVRDIGANDQDLEKVLNDVFRDIAISTKIFKKAFGFEIYSDIERYDFKSLLNMSERIQENDITAISIDPFTDQQLIDILIDPVNQNVNVTIENTVGVPQSTFLEVIDILDKNLTSIFDHFEHITDAQFYYRYNNIIKEPIPMLCICSIIPNIENISEKIETILKPTIIDGLKYFVDTTLNNQNVNPVVSSYKKYTNSKLELQNKFPIHISKQIKRSFL